MTFLPKHGDFVLAGAPAVRFSSSPCSLFLGDSRHCGRTHIFFLGRRISQSAWWNQNSENTVYFVSIRCRVARSWQMMWGRLRGLCSCGAPGALVLGSAFADRAPDCGGGFGLSRTRWCQTRAQVSPRPWGVPRVRSQGGACWVPGEPLLELPGARQQNRPHRP